MPKLLTEPPKNAVTFSLICEMSNKLRNDDLMLPINGNNERNWEFLYSVGTVENN